MQETVMFLQASTVLQEKKTVEAFRPTTLRLSKNKKA
jgi:hypothetical protein